MERSINSGADTMSTTKTSKATSITRIERIEALKLLKQVQLSSLSLIAPRDDYSGEEHLVAESWLHHGDYLDADGVRIVLRASDGTTETHEVMADC
jgi:hypothetical protein